MLKHWLRKDIKSLNLLYRATKDSDKIEIYHKLVDGKKPLLMLV